MLLHVNVYACESIVSESKLPFTATLEFRSSLIYGSLSIADNQAKFLQFAKFRTLPISRVGKNMC